MVEVLGMLDLTLDRVRYASGSSGPDQGARRPAVPGRRRLAAIVRFHTLYFISPLSVPLAHVLQPWLQLLRAPAPGWAASRSTLRARVQAHPGARGLR